MVLGAVIKELNHSKQLHLLKILESRESYGFGKRAEKSRDGGLDARELSLGIT